MTDEGGEVVRLPVSAGAKTHNERRAEDRETIPALVPPHDYTSPYCRHNRVTLDPKLRRCVCDCGQIVEAYDFLVHLAHEWSREMYALHEARAERERLSKTLVDLRREEHNTKSRLRTARTNLKSAEETLADRIRRQARRA